MTTKRKRFSSRLGQPNPPLNQTERLKHLTECCDVLVEQGPHPSVSNICDAAGFAETTLRQLPYWNVVIATRLKVGQRTSDGVTGEPVTKIADPDAVQDRFTALMAQLEEKDAALLNFAVRLGASEARSKSLERRLHDVTNKLSYVEKPAHPARPLVRPVSPP